MDDWDDSDDEWPDDSDDDLETGLRPCPSCGADIYEDAEQCPLCGEYVVRSNSAFAGKPLWWVVLGLIGIVAVMLALTAM